MSKLLLSQMQILAAMCICLSSASFSVNKAITATVIFAFQKNADDQMKMTLEEASWLRKRKAILALRLRVHFKPKGIFQAQRKKVLSYYEQLFYNDSPWKTAY